MANTDQTKKRHWWSNLADAYKITKRTYPWIPWALLAIFGVCIIALVLFSVFTHCGMVRFIFNVLFGIMLGVLGSMILLSRLVQKAFYAQIEGVKGNVSAVLRGIKRGWIVYEEPVAFNRKQDLVWRLVGRPGVVLISEGPASRAQTMLRDEAKKVQRVAPKVPVHTIQAGTGKGQVPIGKLNKEINKLKKAISKAEIPKIDERLQALQAKNSQMPRGVDPTKVKVNRRMMRGK